MAVADWVEIYNDETTDYLKGVRQQMLAQGEATYASQATGSKSYELAISEFRDKLQALTRVLRQRGQNIDDSAYIGTADFSGLGGIS